MKKCLGLLLLALTVPAFLISQDQKTDPAIGTWKLDVAKSKYSPGPPPQSATVTIAEGGKVAVDEVGPDGKPIHYSFTVSQGTPVPIDGMQNSTLTEKRIDDRHVEHTWKFGEQTMMGKAAIAKNGKTMTYVMTGTTHDGSQYTTLSISTSNSRHYFSRLFHRTQAAVFAFTFASW